MGLNWLRLTQDLHRRRDAHHPDGLDEWRDSRFTLVTKILMLSIARFRGSISVQ